MPTDPFLLNPNLDVSDLRARYARAGRVRIKDLLSDDGPQRLHAYLQDHADWRQVLNSNDTFYELDRSVRDAMSDAQRKALYAAVHKGAESGFQYRYETIRVADGVGARVANPDLLTLFASWLSSPAPLAVLKAITGADDTRFVDAQATAYAACDFLTAHDDEVAGKDRRAAYVFGLTPQWRAEWGGLLLFHDRDGMVEGLVPDFNTLDILAVPQLHSVSYVTPSAPTKRYSITGWLRAQRQPV
ncbi:Rps23 Pro-64 3,4-dihydroxylase Tpa1-like proline 4-hydroxylase [Sphingomonas sp. PP-F2F-A104-K0414]|uniref:2OG-Fe(II) oxygenase n=1 Tax=Sphingomonas sp. PP-F2F-A104-K0414 TaxID=2135661 RepID=UPI00104AF47B|nr:2OG-Fe(II) oxygenase family protein [Sphingomonas sp. PP-F2F-A104-K0414]TCP99960.1 Rps23 Pro-64 3,4-dihydroxylase Tpa1-like proline 4-hydroxylase [Sphingomonas sp. PP-F2F-A104-K0414]